MPEIRVRFAPSPTGQLHIGNARTALFNWLLARGSAGTFILRIEDTDARRSTPESEPAIIDDLRWLGLDWDEGPDIGGSRAPYRQSERLALYRSYAAELLAAGLAYYCFCTPEQLEAERRAALAAGQPARYAGPCQHLTPEDAAARVAAGESAAIRFRVPDAREIVFEDAVRGAVSFQTETIGDLIILRTDGYPAYNFAVVVDDALMGITHVIRGEDHISNTPRQLLLYEALGFSPPLFAHVALVMGPDHRPLSKRHGATSVAEFRARGYLPEALLNYLALIGWSPGGNDELLDARELARRFSLAAVGLSAGVFDEEKLAWVNRHYMKLADPARLATLTVPYFRASAVAMEPDAQGLAFLASVMTIAAGSVDRLAQVPARLAFLFDYSLEAAWTVGAHDDLMQAPSAREVVKALAALLAREPRLDQPRFRAIANEIRKQTSNKGRALFHPIRVALTGRSEGPELDLVVPAIDRGAELPTSAGLPSILGCRERATMFAARWERSC